MVMLIVVVVKVIVIVVIVIVIVIVVIVMVIVIVVMVIVIVVIVMVILVFCVYILQFTAIIFSNIPYFCSLIIKLSFNTYIIIEPTIWNHLKNTLIYPRLRYLAYYFNKLFTCSRASSLTSLHRLLRRLIDSTPVRTALTARLPLVNPFLIRKSSLRPVVCLNSRGRGSHLLTCRNPLVALSYLVIRYH